MVETAKQPVRIALFGAGPAGFYAAEHLLKQDLPIEVDLFDRLPAPHGLVRYGVAPDHQKIKNVIRVYDKTAHRPGFRFFGNVTFGQDLTLDDVSHFYHAALFSTGAQVDRHLGIPGEDLAGSHSATEFVAWYNGHPDYRNHTFDLSQERVVIVGVGNVAVDVARILCRSLDELAETDIADYALEALRESRVREIYMLGRRGPAQAAFTLPEVKELGNLPVADVYVRPEEADLDHLSRAALEATSDRDALKKMEVIQQYAGQSATGKPRRLYLRFLISPIALEGDETGHVKAVRCVRNVLYEDNGRLRPRHTGQEEILDAGLVFRSVGYRGVPLPGLPFHDRWGIIPNEAGRVIDPATARPLPGCYVAGWIKRGPSGVIGTNKPDAIETVTALLEDLAEGRHFQPDAPTAQAAEQFIRSKRPDLITYPEWERIDALEVARGLKQGRPRVKFTTAAEMYEALGRTAR